MSRPAISGFGIFDPEWARLVHQVTEAAARLERVKAQSSASSLEYQVALLTYKEALSAVSAAAAHRAGQ